MKQKEEIFTEELFKNPPAVYRGAPFYAWNGKLDKGILKEQINTFEEMGFGGFHIHSRIGLSDEYLGEKFMECVTFCQKYAKSKGMFTYLYDEDKWPSGYGGGRVTQKEEYRARYLLFTPFFHEEGYYDRGLKPSCRLTEDGTLKLLASYRVELEGGRLRSYEKVSGGYRNAEECGKKCVEECVCKEGYPEEGKHQWGEEKCRKKQKIWYAYLVVADSLPWFNNGAYVDVLNPKAISTFTKVCHDSYFEAVGGEFSGSIPSIFTDEPQFIKMQNMECGEKLQEIGIPYTEGLEDEMRMHYHVDLMERLPEIFWESADGKPAALRYQYLNTIADRFADSYVGTLGKWCENHGIMLTGHVMEENGLENQARHVGDAMRSYRYFQMPGIDMLANRYEYTTAKQAASVVRQMDKAGMASELYGVTNWNFDFRGHKLQGDWQAALGVTLRVPHLSWMYMGGESKRDYPAPIDAHSPWHGRYSLIEDYFGRINMALTRGKARVEVCVIHPIESMFMLLGPDKDTLWERNRLEEEFQELARWLLFGQMDFDFLSEALIPKLYKGTEKKRLRIGEMSYRAVVVPPLLTIRSTTLQMLEEFSKNGGMVITMGRLPGCVDGNGLSNGIAVDIHSKNIGFDRHALMKELEECRMLRILDGKGLQRKDLLYQLREEEGRKWLFIAQGHDNRKRDGGISAKGKEEGQIRIEIAGGYDVCLWNAMKGMRESAVYEIRNVCCKTGGCRMETHVWVPFWEHDSVLLELIPKRDEDTESFEEVSGTVKGDGKGHEKVSGHGEKGFERVQGKESQNGWLAEIGAGCIYSKYLPSENSYALEEPNVLLWDMAEYSLDKGPWQECEEILRIDNIARKTFGYRLRTDSFPQPWLSGNRNKKEHIVSLRFRIDSRIDQVKAEIALEGEEDVELTFNGRPMKMIGDKWFVDSCIKRMDVGMIKKGENILECKIPFGSLTNLEWVYLLGDFGVEVKGRKRVLIPLPEKIGFGDYVQQGFPYYGGNFCYETVVEIPEGDAELLVDEYEASLIEVEVDGQKPVAMFAAPYRIALGRLQGGKHRLKIRSYGSRINMFGQLHNCNPYETYFGPGTWRTEGENWCYEYRLHRCGILKAPVLKVWRCAKNSAEMG
ncbi:hypothetical protein IMSAGC002_01134 [Lachnospiraceae bacterium]|nr:hypothetical protein IMSAGC002_01134 [Lachnospiraceae bacterium]